MTYERALALLDARQETRIVLGLHRVRAVLRRLGDPQDAVPSYHVAGTNGKGSTCALLDAALRASGRRTGLYTSPHLFHVRERIKIDGKPIGRAAFAAMLQRVLAAENGTTLTYFELLTCAAFLHFREAGCDVAVLETGLGGRLDATNVVSKPLATLITSIGYDHMAFLGKTLTLIAGEKAGIAKKGVPMFCAPLKPEAMRVVRQKSPNVIVVKPWKTVETDWVKGKQKFENGVVVGLVGDRQGGNAALAAAVLRCENRGLTVTESALRRGFRSVAWTCRFEIIRVGKKRVVIDGAHNPEAAASLARTWKRSPFSRGRSRWILGLLRDKDAAAVLAPLAPSFDQVTTVAPPSPRALAASDLATLLRSRARGEVSVEPNVGAALRRWRQERNSPDTAVVCGSFYLAGAAATALEGARA